MMNKYRDLKKPNHWKIVLFLDQKRQNRYNTSQLSRELNMDQSHIRKYLNELEDLGFIHTHKIKGKIEVIL